MILLFGLSGFGVASAGGKGSSVLHMAIDTK
jgi:hypothetical protein